MTATKIFLSGVGKMGREILQLTNTEPQAWQVTGYSSQSAKADLKIPFLKAQDLDLDPLNVDVIVDFSRPETLRRILKLARRQKLAVVCGTTGLSTADFEVLKETSEQAPILWASNMSVGVAVLKHAIKSLKAVSDFDFQIEEFHHGKKIDSPSGTALSLQAELERTVGKTLPTAIGIRGGGIFGIHSVHAMGAEETLEFKHTALNRTVFARGALRAAAWLVQQSPGFYSMEDVLGLKDLG